METKSHWLFMSSLTPLPRFCKCHQIHALWFMVNKGKMKGGRGLSSLPHQEQQLETLDLLTGPCVLQSLGSGFFQALLIQGIPEAQTSLLPCNWPNQQAQLSPANTELLLPAHSQAGWIWSSAMCSTRAAPSSSSGLM